MSLELYFLRHGQTDHSRENMFCGCGSNPGLTADGRRMAELFAEAYKSYNWAAVYCSPLLRAQETALPLGTQAEIRDGIKEIDFGKWEGLTTDEVKKLYPEAYERWQENPNFFSPVNGERSQDVLKRSQEVIDEILQKHSSGKVLLVSHKATIRIQICAFLGIDLADYRIKLACPVASLSKVVIKGEGAQLVTLADRSHLTEELRVLQGT